MTLVIAIQEDRLETPSYSDIWAQTIISRGHRVKKVNLYSEQGFTDALACDGVMWRWAHCSARDRLHAPRILQALRAAGVPTFPNHDTAWHYDDKIAQKYLFDCLGIAAPKTWVFTDLDTAIDWSRSTSYPKVFKLATGAGSSNVMLVHNAHQAVRLCRQLFDDGLGGPRFTRHVREGAHSSVAKRILTLPTALAREAIRHLRHGLNIRWPMDCYPRTWQYGYAYFQEFIPGNEFDTRITVIGERAFAYRRMNRPNDFRASGSGLLDYDMDAVDLRCVETSFDISNKAGFQSCAYDFIFRGDEPVVTEISYTFIGRYVAHCPGYWDPQLNWHPEPLRPEAAMADDFLEKIASRRAVVCQ